MVDDNFGFFCFSIHLGGFLKYLLYTSNKLFSPGSLSLEFVMVDVTVAYILFHHAMQNINHSSIALCLIETEDFHHLGFLFAT